VLDRSIVVDWLKLVAALGAEMRTDLGNRLNRYSAAIVLAIAAVMKIPTRKVEEAGCGLKSSIE
jgi:hypothetical protein